MKKIEFCAGINIDRAYEILQEAHKNSNEEIVGEFNGKTISSNNTLDEAYLKITGKTKEEFDKEKKRKREEYERREEMHKASIPALSEKYKNEARGLVLEDKLEYWDEIVPIRLADLYHGMELKQVLHYCAIMRKESTPYEDRLREAYDYFMNSGHSGMSAHLTAGMIKLFCPHGQDLADAVINFRFENKEG